MGSNLANIDDIVSDKSDISRAEIYQIASQVHDDEADPRDVRRLLEYIYDLVDRQNPPPPELQRYVADSLRVFLDGSAKSLARLRDPIGWGVAIVARRLSNTVRSSHLHIFWRDMPTNNPLWHSDCEVQRLFSTGGEVVPISRRGDIHRTRHDS